MKIPTTAAPSVGIRDFRAALADSIDDGSPVAATRHGQAMSLLVRLRRPSADDLQREPGPDSEVRGPASCSRLARLGGSGAPLALH